MKIFNQLWDFFASVKLAIFTLCALAISSIAGTIVPQGEPQLFYVQRYGEKTAAFMHILDIDTMYASWWFIALLLLLCANLIICSIDRFPAVWRIIANDNRNISLAKLEGMSFHHQWSISANQSETVDFSTLLRSCGWRTVNRTTDGNIAFSQKGKWSRVGVYVVHLSILVIFLGAFIGSLYGEKGSVMLPEQKSTSTIFHQKNSSTIDLGFEVRCDSFNIEFYPNGMPKEYTSHLTVLEDGKEVLSQSIEVNHPLQYKGFTFYQSSYQGYKDFIISITDQNTKETHNGVVPFQKQSTWPSAEIKYGIINAEAVQQQVTREKVWFKVGEMPAQVEWLENNTPKIFSAGDTTYSVRVKQMYATGLQVARDPGVYVVYLGCGLMLAGLYMAFFMSHRRIWMYRQQQEGQTMIHLAGSTNKNKLAFKTSFKKIVDSLETLLKS